MFCKNCGKEILENQAFCTECGARVETAVEEVKAEPEVEVVAEPETEVVAEPEAEVVAETEAEVNVEAESGESVNVDTFEEAEQVEMQQPVRKKKAGLIVGLVSAAVVVAIAVLVAFNFNFVKGFAVKTFGSDTDYLRFVEQQSINSSIDNITEAYAGIIEEKAASSYTVKLQPKLSSSVQELIGENLTGDTDLDWINKLSVSATSKMSGDKAAAALALALADSDVLKFDFIADTEKQAVYFAISNLSDKFIKADVDLDAAVEIGESSKILGALDDPEFKKVLPSEKELNELLRKYADIIVDNLEAVSTSTMDLTVGELEGSFTVIEYEINEEKALGIAEEILKTAKEDTELKEIVESVCGYLSDKELIDPDIDYYDEFEELINDGIDAVEEAVEEADDDDSIVIKSFVNSKHEICGRIVEIDGEEIINSVTIQKGTKFATETEISDVKIEGSGEVKGTKLDAEYTLRVRGKAYLDVIIEDADVIKLGEKKFNGTVRIELTDTLIEEIGDSEFSDIMEEYDFALEFVIAAEEKTSKVEVNVLSKGDLFAGFDITTTLNESDGEITVPSDTIDATDNEALIDWAESLDTDKVLDLLRDKGLDEDVVSIAESFLMSFKSALDFDDSDDYYGDGLDDMYGDSYDDIYGDSYDDIYGDSLDNDIFYDEDIYVY